MLKLHVVHLGYRANLFWYFTLVIPNIFFYLSFKTVLWFDYKMHWYQCGYWQYWHCITWIETIFCSPAAPYSRNDARGVDTGSQMKSGH